MENRGDVIVLHILWLFMMLMPVFSLTACASAGGYVSGKVIDADTSEPMQGVHVMIDWYGDINLYVQSDSECIHADSAVTDANGKFRFHPWVKETHRITPGSVDWSLNFFMEGYSEVWKRRREASDNLYRMTKFEGTNNERFEYLKQHFNHTGCDDDDVEKFIPVMRSMYKESKEVAVTKDDYEFVYFIRDLLRSAGVTDLESSEIHENYEQRMQFLEQD